MRADPVTPETTLALLLGASEWPRHPRLGAARAFRRSADELQAYLTSSDGLALPIWHIKNVFDLDAPADEMLEELQKFVDGAVERGKASGSPIRDLLVFYIGHGGFNGEEYYLAIRRTRQGMEGTSSLRVRDLALALKDSSRRLRRYLLLDCCFAASAVKEFQSGAVTEVVRQRTLDAFPDKGTALLCAASAKAPARTLEDEPYTMFGGALLDVLKRGDTALGSHLSLEEVGSLLVRRLRESYADEAVRPEVHSPDQREGDIADLPLFPNAAVKPRALDVRVATLEGSIASLEATLGASIAALQSTVADTRQAVPRLEQLIQSLGASTAERFSQLQENLSERYVSSAMLAESKETRRLPPGQFGFSDMEWDRVPAHIKRDLFRYRSARLAGMNLVGVTCIVGAVAIYLASWSRSATFVTSPNPIPDWVMPLYLAACAYHFLALVGMVVGAIMLRFPFSRPEVERSRSVGGELRHLDLPEPDVIAKMDGYRVARMGGLNVASPFFEVWSASIVLVLGVLFALARIGGPSPLWLFVSPTK